MIGIDGRRCGIPMPQVCADFTVRQTRRYRRFPPLAAVAAGRVARQCAVATLRPGMSLGGANLAVGVHPSRADTWALQDVLAQV